MGRLLIVGPRRGLCRAATRLGIPFVVWSESPRRIEGAEAVIVGPFAGEARAQKTIEELKKHGPFSDVTAGTESSVLAAAMARRALGARYAPTSTVIKCHDKLHMKRWLTERGVPMTAFADGSTFSDTELEGIGFPCVLKDRRSSGGRKMSWIASREELAAAVTTGRLLERAVDAPETSVESFVSGGKVLFENVTNYYQKGWVNIVPARHPNTEEILKLNRQTIQTLRIDWGMTHAELYLLPERLLLGEIALRPPGGFIMDLLELAYGFDPWEMFLRVSLDEEPVFPAAATKVAAAVILHPGPGKVRAVEGSHEVERHPCVHDVKLRVKAGDVVEPRLGTGQSVGRILLLGDTHDEVEAAVEQVQATIRIVMA